MRVIVHIGAGKTGTSSIQQTLTDNFEFLLSQGVLYAGRSFNSLGNDKSWKNKNLGFGLNKEEITDVYIHELNKYIKYAKQHDCKTLILCNEAFGANLSKLFNFFTHLQKNNYQLEICYYLRSPESWTKSAYEQWAIRHKTFEGKILSAKDYICLKTYKSLINPLYDLRNTSFYESLSIVNLDKVNDAVGAFLEVYDLPKLENSNVNQSVDSASLAFYYYLNNKVTEVAGNRKGNILTDMFRRITSVEDFQDKIEVKSEYYDQEEMVEFKKDLNQFLKTEEQFDSDFKLSLRTKEKLSNRELKLIKLCTELFEVAYQAKLRQDIFKKMLDEDVRLSEKEKNTIARLSRYIDNSIIG